MKCSSCEEKEKLGRYKKNLFLESEGFNTVQKSILCTYDMLLAHLEANHPCTCSEEY